MSETLKLTATARDRAGKGAARAARREGLVPAVIYGDKKSPEMINVERRVISKLYETGHFLSTVYDIDVDGKATRVIPKSIDLDKVKDFPIHVDFLRLSKGAKVTVEVTVHFNNEEKSPGLRKGGVLNIVRHEVEVECPADAIPEYIEADLTGLDMGDSLHISAVTLPAGVVPTITDRDFTIATIATPASVQSEAAEGEEETGAAAVAPAAEEEDGEED
ncbi:MAG: 50S ribosomal protein L25/general stress protein Ctc [Rhodobiaceae bacterium]|nr:50S ribosomal protein L25/general stress protein Ctc [Rhodobiaceae bacterium]